MNHRILKIIYNEQEYSVDDILIHRDGSYLTTVKDFYFPFDQPECVWFTFDKTDNVRDLKNFEKAGIDAVNNLTRHSILDTELKKLIL